MKIYYFLILSLLIKTLGYSQIPVLNSRPSATAVLYLDFDGHSDNSGYWDNWGYSNPIVTAASTMNSSQITEIHKGVSEDFIVFNINVTTSSSVYSAAPSNLRQRVVITPTDNFYNNSSNVNSPAGGVAALGYFGAGEIACFAFENQLGYFPKYIGDACSHELGHTLNLNHQAEYSASCNKTLEYNNGTSAYSNEQTGWAPLMGSSYYRNLSTWYHGPGTTSTCSGNQDDIAVILTNGFSYFSDEGNTTAATASTITLTDFNLDKTGTIKTKTENDYFKITAPWSTGIITPTVPIIFFALPASVSSSSTYGNYGTNHTAANLDLNISLYNSSGATLLAESINDDNRLDATFTYNVEIGTQYIIRVNGEGLDSYRDIGYKAANDYGSIGRYNLLSFQPGEIAAGNQTICFNSVPSYISFSRNPSASSGLTYTWYYKNGIVSAPSINASVTDWILDPGGQNSSGYTPSNLTASRTYACRVSYKGISAWAGGVRQITVDPGPEFNAGVIASNDQVFDLEGQPSAVSFAVTPSGGGMTAFTYTWYYKFGLHSAPTGYDVPSGWIRVIGNNSASYTPPFATSNITYAAMVYPITSSCAYNPGLNQTQGKWAEGSRKITVTNGCLSYCQSSGVSGSYLYNNQLTIGSNSFPSGNNGGYYNIGLTGTSGTYYTNQFYSFTINVSGETNAYSSRTIRANIYADWNKDNDFEDGEELLYTSESFIIEPTGDGFTIPFSYLFSGGFSIPSSAVLGRTTLRIIVKDEDVFTPDVPCWIGRGEVEDYCVIISDGNSFTPGAISAGNVNLCNPADPANITFSTAATASSTYQWYFQDGIIAAPAATAALTGWTSIASATLATYDAPSGLTASRTYACRVTNGTNSQWASGVRQITVLPVVNFGTLAAGNQSFTGSGDPANIAFATAPTGGAGTYSYQWYSQAGIIAAPTGTATTGWSPISGGTTSNYNPPIQSASISYAVQVNPTGTPDCGAATWATGVRQITVNATAFTSGILTAGNVNLCNPADPASITFSTAATAGSSFQWYFQDGIIAAPAATAALTGWTSIASATLATYDAPAGLTASRTYACRVTNGANSQWASGVIQITVLPVVNFGTLAAGNQSFTGSGDPANIAFATAATGGAGTYSYQWYSQAGIIAAPTGTATTGWTLITGATAASYDPLVQSASISYAVQVNPTGTPDCGAATWASGVRQITVNATAFTPGILTVGNQTLCNPADPANITFSTAATAGSTFQWYFQDGIIAAPAATAALTGWTSIASATLATYDAPSGLTASRTYACRVTNGTNSQWASGVRQITVLPVVNFGTLAAGNQSFTGSGDPANIAFATAATGGAGTYSYQWYSQAGIIAAPTGTATTGWTLITGATAASYDPLVQSASISYAVQVNPTGTPDCGAATWSTGVRQITVNTTAFTSGILTAGNQTLCNPADPANITFSTAATAGSSFQWYFQDGIIAAPAATAALTGWTSIASATLATYDAPAGLTASRTYACRVTNGTNSQWASGVRQISVLPVFNPGSLIANQTGCNAYDPVSITMATNPLGSGAYNWRWYYWENTTQVCPTGSTVPTGAVTSTTDLRFFGTSTTGSGIFFDPTSPGTNGRTWALLITPAANGAIPACGVAQFTSTCHKTIRQVCRIGQGEESVDQGIIDTPFLGQSYPNPNQGKFNIEYFLPSDCQGEIVIYDITGKKLAQSDCETGRRQTLEFDVQHLSQGTYYYSLECNGLKMETRKMVLVK